MADHREGFPRTQHENHVTWQKVARVIFDRINLARGVSTEQDKTNGQAMTGAVQCGAPLQLRAVKRSSLVPEGRREKDSAWLAQARQPGRVSRA
jgi:hypothetical protein